MNSFIRGYYSRKFFKTWKFDIVAGFVVSLMALPMSLGIAIASGFPPMAGILTAVIGGLFVSFMAGSELTIKGPAGGLSAIAFGAVVALGQGNVLDGYKFALATIVVAGALQMLFGAMKLGTLGDFFPASTIHGMLAALGIIMAVKQIHLALGVTPNGTTPFELIAELPDSLVALNPKIALIGAITLAILILMSYFKGKFTSIFPAPLLALLVVIPLGLFLGINVEHVYTINSKTYSIYPDKFLLNIPNNLSDGIMLADFSHILTIDSLQYIMMFALAGSIETLLSTKAIDKLDPVQRISNLNKDLFAVGLGTFLSGLFGGLPIISESKRSVININQGAKSRWANFFHGIFLALIVIFALPLIKLIPYAALAAMLIYTGARMATPKEFSKSYKIGAEQFLVFMVTLLVTMATNFLIGVGVGLITELIIHIKFGVNFGALFKSNLELKNNSNNDFEVIFNGPAIFSNYPGVRNMIEQIPNNSHITFDFAQATVVDHTFMEHLHSYQTRRSTKGGQVYIIGLDYHKHLSDHPLAAKRIVKQDTLNSRQLQMKDFADEKDYQFDHRTISNTSKFNGFNFAEGTAVKIEENIIKHAYKSNEIEIADILMERSGNSMMKQDYKMTILAITVSPEIILPNFTLQKEGFVDTLFALTGFNDIDFEQYPKFSYYYLLKGSNELHIRNFFKGDIITYFEQNKGYHLEAQKNTLLVFKRPDILEVDEIESMNTFATKLIDVLVYKFSD